jgi:hypothetical protein
MVLNAVTYLVSLPTILPETAEEMECKLEINFIIQTGLAATFLDLKNAALNSRLMLQLSKMSYLWKQG